MISSAADTSRVAAGSLQPREDPNKVRAAASDFEALLLAQLLRSARESASLDGSGTEADKSSDSIMDFAEQQFGSILARAGGLGIANLVATGLAQKG